MIVCASVCTKTLEGSCRIYVRDLFTFIGNDDFVSSGRLHDLCRGYAVFASYEHREALHDFHLSFIPRIAPLNESTMELFLFLFLYLSTQSLQQFNVFETSFP